MEVRDRLTYLGGSDCAGILGVSRYKTALQVWALKTGQVVPEDISDKVPVKLGNKLEQTVAEFFADETGHVVVPVTKEICDINGLRYFEHTEDGQQKIVALHRDHDFIGGMPDRFVHGLPAGLECKTTSIYKQREWEGEDIPLEYVFQCLHYMVVTGLPMWYLAVIIGNQIFDWKVLVREDFQRLAEGMPAKKINTVKLETLAEILKKEVHFWNTFVVPKVMPMTVSSRDGGILNALYPTAEPETIIELGDDTNKIVESLDSMEADFKSLELQIEEQKNTLKAMLQGNEMGLTNKYRITWKNVVSHRVDVKRLKEEKPEIYAEYAPASTARRLNYSVIKKGGK